MQSERTQFPALWRAELERLGLAPEASPGAAQEFYQRLPLDQKGRLGLALGEQAIAASAAPRLTLRQEVTRDLTSRTMTIRAATANEADRSVEAVLATENEVEVHDWMSGEILSERLLMSGVQLPPQLPLLDNHYKGSLDAVLGSIRNLRVEHNQLVGRLFFAGDDPSLRAWAKVRDGHLTDISVGYRVGDGAVRIPAGQTASVAGRTFTAGKRSLRVTTLWTPREGSLLAIGADQAAKIRGDETTFSQRQETSEMPPTLRAYLEQHHGLRADATDAEAQTLYAGLTLEQRAAADGHQGPGAGAPPPEGQRTAPPVQPPAHPPAPGLTEDQVRQAAITAERERVRQITELAGTDVSPETRQRAIAEGWTAERAAPAFLTEVRGRRAPQNPAVQGPAIHSRSFETDLSVRSLSAALIARAGDDPTQARLYDGRRGRRGEPLTAQDADRGERFSRLPAVDLCRMCVQLDTGRIEMDPEEAVRMAVSGASLNHVFSTNVYARIVAGWNEIPDSTGWCASEADIPNFLIQEDITLQKGGAALDKLPRGGTANDAILSDQHETYRLGRYAKKFTVDEQDLLDDRLGAILAMPFEMGQAARRLRPDLVYSTLLANPALVADGTALFHTDHSNLGTGALSTTSFAAAIQAMSEQREGSVVLGIRPRYMVVPGALMFTAGTILHGVALAKTHGTRSDPDYIPLNAVSNAMLQILQQQQVELVVDDRVGAAGVYDPRDKVTRTGSATNWFLSAGGQRTIRVGTRRGTNGMPVMRQYTLDRGQWGIGWDINFDVCVIVADYPGLYKSTGAA
jgi:hypothetical protein